jgi:hypothetical protein
VNWFISSSVYQASNRHVAQGELNLSWNMKKQDKCGDVDEIGTRVVLNYNKSSLAVLPIAGI